MTCFGWSDPRHESSEQPSSSLFSSFLIARALKECECLGIWNKVKHSITPHPSRAEEVFDLLFVNRVWKLLAVVNSVLISVNMSNSLFVD